MRRDLAERIGRDLDEIAGAAASPSSTTMASLLARLGEPSDTSHAELILFSSEDSRAWGSRRLVLLGAGAVVVMLALGAITLIDSSRGSRDRVVVDGVPALLDGSSTVSVDGAVAFVDGYFGDLDAGDPAAALDRYSPAATVTVDEVPQVTEVRVGYAVGEGAQTTRLNCDAADARPDRVTVECRYETLDAAALAIDAPGFTWEETFTVTAEGISGSAARMVSIRHTEAAFGFEEWLQATQTTAVLEAVGCVGCTTADDARSGGELRAQLASDWAAAVRASGCTYFDTDCVIAGQ